MGRGNVQKTCDFWGLFGQIRVKKGRFLAKKDREKASFCVRKGKLAVTEGFSGQKRTLCPKCGAPENHPGSNAPSATDETLLNHGGEAVPAALFGAEVVAGYRELPGQGA